MSERTVTGSEALALGALEAGVQLATGYPGSPSTGTVEALLQLADEQLRIEWAINEKSAFDAAFGASLAGVRALLCLKSVGLNVGLDSLMVSNLAAGDGGFVILAGDDPGGWGSQNEEDSRLLAAAAEVPLLEPTGVAEARRIMHHAFELSEQFQVPVVVRITRALASDQSRLAKSPARVPQRRAASFQRQPERFNVLPIDVVAFHHRLQATLSGVQAHFEQSALNVEEGQGRQGIIAAGQTYHKMTQVLAEASTSSSKPGNQPPLRILRLSTINPLPANRIVAFLCEVDAALVLEEIAPYVETQVQAIAQRAALTLPVYGRSSGHIPGTGELFAPHIAQGLAALLPDWPWPAFEQVSRPMPSRQPLCDDCPYIHALEALLAVMERHGGRDNFVVTGETGCMVRAQLPPWEILDVKYGMGSSIGLASGLAGSGIPQKLVALSGDSALLHSGLGELIDAVQAGIAMLVVVLANETTALSGGQPHPATTHDARGNSRKPVDLVALIQAAGVDLLRVVDPKDTSATRAALEEGLTSGRLAVVVVQRACPRWEKEPAS
jgi:indolepyruvate ferredoxin oxidoreductase alpha subunit